MVLTRVRLAPAGITAVNTLPSAIAEPLLNGMRRQLPEPCDFTDRTSRVDRGQHGCPELRVGRHSLLPRGTQQLSHLTGWRLLRTRTHTTTLEPFPGNVMYPPRNLALT